MNLKDFNIKKLGPYITKNAESLLGEVVEAPSGTFKIPFVNTPTKSSRGTYLGYVKLWDLAMTLSTEANSRNTVIKGPISRDIRDTFLHAGDRTDERSKGLTILSSMATPDPTDPTGRMLLVDFKKGEEGMGITDGGTTYGNYRIVRRVAVAIKATLAGNKDANAEDLAFALEIEKNLKAAEVAVEVFSKLTNDERLDISYCRNRTNKQQLKSMLHLRGKFDALEHALGDYASSVIFHEQQQPAAGSEPRFTPVEEVIKLVTLFANQKRKIYGTQIYGGAFMKNFDEKHSTDEYLNAIANIQEICELNEQVYRLFCSRIRKEGKRPLGVTDQETPLPYSRKVMDYFIPAAYVHPVTGALRLLLQKGEWVVNPKSFVKKHGHALIDAVEDAMGYVKKNDPTRVNVTAFGRSEPVWKETLQAMAFAMADEGIRLADTEDARAGEEEAA